MKAYRDGAICQKDAGSAKGVMEGLRCWTTYLYSHLDHAEDLDLMFGDKLGEGDQETSLKPRLAVIR
jgi:hypothetical protein